MDSCDVPYFNTLHRIIKSHREDITILEEKMEALRNTFVKLEDAHDSLNQKVLRLLDTLPDQHLSEAPQEQSAQPYTLEDLIRRVAEYK